MKRKSLLYHIRGYCSRWNHQFYVYVIMGSYIYGLLDDTIDFR